MAAITQLATFVAGKHAAMLEGVSSAIIEQCAGETFARAPVSLAANLDAAFTAAAAVFGACRDTTPGGRSLAFLPIAGALRPDFGVVWISTHVPSVAEMRHGCTCCGHGKDLSIYGFGTTPASGTS